MRSTEPLERVAIIVTALILVIYCGLVFLS